MAEHLSLGRLREVARDPDAVSAAPFEVLQEAAAWLNQAADDDTRYAVRDVLIRLLENRDSLDGCKPLLDALVRQVGLYPYIDPEHLTISDAIAYEAHRPLNPQTDDLVFHEVQAHVYRLLLGGENVILSAPTSFGKSLIIDSLIASDRYNNVAVVVPTIALLDETRRRLARFSDRFRVITHVSQEVGERNLFVLTQERVIDHPSLPNMDLFVIDEFYKLHGSADPERSSLLNQAFYKLWKMGGQFYFLGPNIQSLPENLPKNFDVRFIKTDYSTVAFDVVRVESGGDERERLTALCATLDEPTLIFCRSPRQARKVAAWLLETNVAGPAADADLSDAADWIGESFHEKWLFGRALRQQIGIHHGRLPRSLAYFAVRAFNQERLRFLVCTSTLIEGVNTAAKNVIVFDNRIATKKYDYFTFRNIQGRSGRMFRHYIGRVFLFHEPPPEELPFVDIPVLTQPDTAPDTLLVQVDPADLTEPSAQRMEKYYAQDILPIEVLRANSGISLDEQIEVARQLRADTQAWYPSLKWTGFPEYEQLAETCKFVWRLTGSAGWSAGVASAAQLAYKISHLREGATIKQMILEELTNDYNPHQGDPDETVEAVLEFIRQWPGYRFPRALMALDRIQRAVFAEAGLPPGDYSLYAAQVENLFLPPFLGALDEYGIPTQIAERLAPWLSDVEGLDDLLARLEALKVSALPLSEFEREMVRHAQEGLA
jgi:hypothetical protein